MGVGLGVLGLAPGTFWSMTPKELNAAIRGRLGPSAEAQLLKSDVAAMMRRFPDP